MRYRKALVPSVAWLCGFVDVAFVDNENVRSEKPNGFLKNPENPIVSVNVSVIVNVIVNVILTVTLCVSVILMPHMRQEGFSTHTTHGRKNIHCRGSVHFRSLFGNSY